MSLFSLSSFTPTELRDSDLSDGFTIVLPKSITPSTTKISAQLSAHLDKAKQKFSENRFNYKIGWDNELDREEEREKTGAKEERRRSRSGERRRSGSKEGVKKKRSSSQDTLSSLSDGLELDLASYTRRLKIKRQFKSELRSLQQVRPPLKARSSRPVIPPRSREQRRSKDSSVTSSSDEEDEPVESTSESELDNRTRETRARTPRAPTTPYIVHGRTDVLPALPLDPHSAFLAAYRLTHLTGPSPSSPHSPSSPSFSPFDSNASKDQDPASQLPLHLVPAINATEKRARRLALLLDSEDRPVRDWALEEYVKLSSSGRTLVSEGVFALPSSRPSSPSLTAEDPEIEMSDFEDASVSEAGFGSKRRKRADTFQKAEDDERGRKLEALAKRLESTREMAEEREELERERAWAQETFGRWMKDGRADTVFREAASILDALLRHMAREDGEEWAMAPSVATGPAVPDDMTSIRPDESASVADYGERERASQPTPTPAPVEGTVTESSGLETQITMKRAPVALAPINPPPAVAPAPEVPAPLKPSAAPVKVETTKPTPPAVASKIPKLTPPDKRDTVPEPKRRDSTKRDDEREKATAPELKRSTSKRDEGGNRDEGAAKRPNGVAPELKRADSSSRPQIKRADSGSKAKQAAAPAAPTIPKSTPLPPKTPLKPHPPPQSTAQTNSQESQESGTSTIAAPPKPNFIPTTSSPAVPTRAEPQYESYADFYERDPRRVKDDRPIRPHPAYANQFNGPSKPTPEQVFGTYADFYKGRSVAGSTVSRRSKRSDKGKDGKRREKDSEKGKRHDERARQREREKAVADEYEPPHSILIRTQSPSLPRRSSKSKKPLSPSPEHDPLEDIAVSSRISLETGRLTTPGQSRAASPEGAGGSGRRPRARRRSSAGLTTPPQSRGPSPPPPPPPKPTKDSKKSGKKSGKAQRLRGGAPSPSPPPIRRFGAVMPQPPPSEATQGPLIPLESDAGTAAPDASGEAAFGLTAPLPGIQFWMPPAASSPHHDLSSDSDNDTDFPRPRPTPSTVFLAMGSRRACVPYTPAFTGTDMRVVSPVSARERLALRDAGAILIKLGARVQIAEERKKGEEIAMWSLSYVGV